MIILTIKYPWWRAATFRLYNKLRMITPKTGSIFISMQKQIRIVYPFIIKPNFSFYLIFIEMR